METHINYPLSQIMRERVDSVLRLAACYGQALTHTAMLLPDSLRAPLLAASFLSVAPMTPSVSVDLIRTGQSSSLCPPGYQTIYFVGQILMVDVQQRTFLGIFTEVAQLETKYYFRPKQHTPPQS